jgi:hypothetical protein
VTDAVQGDAMIARAVSTGKPLDVSFNTHFRGLLGVGFAGPMANFESIPVTMSCRQSLWRGRRRTPATGCGFLALRGWASANDQAKTRECRLDAMIL